MKKVFDLDAIRKQKSELQAKLEKMETFLELAEELGIDSFDSTNDVSINSNGKANRNSNSIIEWDKNLSFRKKIQAAIQESNKFSHVSEIAKIMKSHGEKENVAGSKDDLQARVSAALSAMKKTPELGIAKFAEEGSVRNQFWGFLKWMDNGKVKDEYMYVKK